MTHDRLCVMTVARGVMTDDSTPHTTAHLPLLVKLAMPAYKILTSAKWSEKRALMAIVAVMTDCELTPGSLRSAASTLNSTFDRSHARDKHEAWYENGELVDRLVAHVSKNAAHKIKCTSWLKRLLQHMTDEELGHLLVGRQSDGTDFGPTFVIPDFSLLIEDAIKGLDAIFAEKLADIGEIAVN